MGQEVVARYVPGADGTGMSSFEERREQQEFQKESVWVSFQTRADLESLTDEELADLGRFVVEIAGDKRKKQEQGLQ